MLLKKMKPPQIKSIKLFTLDLIISLGVVILIYFSVIPIMWGLELQDAFSLLTVLPEILIAPINPRNIVEIQTLEVSVLIFGFFTSSLIVTRWFRLLFLIFLFAYWFVLSTIILLGNATT